MQSISLFVISSPPKKSWIPQTATLFSRQQLHSQNSGKGCLISITRNFISLSIPILHKQYRRIKAALKSLPIIIPPNMAQPTPKAGTTTPGAPNQTVQLTDRTARRQNALSTQYDSDPTSSEGSSSEEDSESESEDEQHTDRQANGTEASAKRTNSDSLPHISARSKPHIRSIKGDSEMLSKLNAFLPQIKSANEDLQKKIDAGTAEDLVLDNAEANGGRYIEMVCQCANHILIVVY